MWRNKFSIKFWRDFSEFYQNIHNFKTIFNDMSLTANPQTHKPKKILPFLRNQSLLNLPKTHWHVLVVKLAVHFIVHNCNISNSLNLHFKLSRLKRFSRLRETSKTKFRLSDDKVSQSRSRTSAGWNENLYFDVVTAWERRKSRSFSLIARSSLQIGLNEITLILNGFVIFCGFT